MSPATQKVTIKNKEYDAVVLHGMKAALAFCAADTKEEYVLAYDDTEIFYFIHYKQYYSK